MNDREKEVLAKYQARNLVLKEKVESAISEANKSQTEEGKLRLIWGSPNTEFGQRLAEIGGQQGLLNHFAADFEIVFAHSGLDESKGVLKIVLFLPTAIDSSEIDLTPGLLKEIVDFPTGLASISFLALETEGGSRNTKLLIDGVHAMLPLHAINGSTLMDALFDLVLARDEILESLGFEDEPGDQD